MQKTRLSLLLALVVLCLFQLSAVAHEAKETAVVDAAKSAVIQSPQSLFSSIFAIIMKFFYYIADQLASLRKYLFPSLARQTKQISAPETKDVENPKTEKGSSSRLYYLSYIPAVCICSLVLFA